MANDRYYVHKTFKHTTMSGTIKGVKGDVTIVGELIAIQAWDHEELHTFLPLSPKHNKAFVTKSVPDGPTAMREIEGADIIECLREWFHCGLIDRPVREAVERMVLRDYQFARDIASTPS